MNKVLNIIDFEFEKKLFQNYGHVVHFCERTKRRYNFKIVNSFSTTRSNKINLQQIENLFKNKQDNFRIICENLEISIDNERNVLVIRKKKTFRCELFEDGYYTYYGKDDIITQSEVFCILMLATHLCYCQESSCICIMLISKYI